MCERVKSRSFFFLCLILLAAVTVHAQQGNGHSAPPKNAIVEQLHVTYRFQNDGKGKITHTVRLRILTEAGLRLYGTVYSAYSSRLERLHIDYLRTIKADGTVISADPSKAMDITPPVTRAAPMFSDVKIKALVAPQLQVGDEIDYKYTRTIRTPYMAGNFWAMYSLFRSDPIKSATVVLDIPAGRKVSFESSPCFHYSVQIKNGRKVYEWHIQNLKIPKDLEDPRPPLFAVSTLSSWKQVADWYTRLQRNGQKVTPQIQALAAKLTAGKTTRIQKLDAIYTYVSENIRYVALEFGIGGYRAHAASVVLANGYGDCKDKSTLLATLLAAVGIKAYPALVNAVSTQFEPAVPMPSQFDHEMTFVPMDGKNIWLDSTMQTAPPGILSPRVLGKRSLLIEPGDSRLITVPAAPPSPQINTATVTGSVNAAGKLALNYDAKANGISGVFMRQIFRLQDKSQVAKFVKAMARLQLSGAKGSNSSSSNPNDLTKAFRYQYKLMKADYVDLLEKNQQVRLPILLIIPNQWQAQISEAEKESKKNDKSASESGCATNPKKTITLYGPFQVRETLNLAIPSSYQVILPEPIHVVRPFGSYTSSYTFDHGHLEMKRDLRISPAKIPLAQLEMLKNFQDLINDDLGQELTLQRMGNAGVISDVSSMTASQLDNAGVEALIKHDKPVLARDLLLKAVAKDPKSQSAWNDLGRAYYAIGNLYQAAKAYKRQIAVNPYDQYALNNLGIVAEARGHFSQAISYYKQQLSVNPLDKLATVNLGEAYDHMRNWSAATAAYAVAVRVHPRNPFVYIDWGTALLRSGRTAEGRQVLTRAIEISKTPVVLNNAAYGMAQAGIDLEKAEGDARSAVDQTIPENVGSVEVPKDYDSTLIALSSYLDTLGWTLKKEGKPAEAQSYLEAAFRIQHARPIAVHLAVVSMEQKNPSAALRYYSYAVDQFGGTLPHIPKSLKRYLQSHGNVPKMTATHVAAVHKQIQELDRLTPHGHSFDWPHSAGAASAWVALNVLVDQAGDVTDAKVFRGSASYSSAALNDVRQLHFPPLAWPHHSLATVRTAYFLYNPSSPNPEERVMAFGNFGGLSKPHEESAKRDLELMTTDKAAQLFMAEGHIRAGLEVLREEAKSSKDVPEVYRFMVLMAKRMRQDGELRAATAVLRQAVPLQPKDDFAVRQLAKALKASGDRAGAIKTYQKLLKMDPEDAESHYSLATEYEAEATAQGGSETVHTGGKVARSGSSKSIKGSNRASKLHLALTQYSLAEKFSPKNATYRRAYESLYEKINHTPPPVAATVPHKSTHP